MNYVKMPKNTLNEMLLRHSQRILLTPAYGSTPASFIATFNLNLQDLGYTLAPATITAIKKLDKVAMVHVFDDTIEALKKLKGANVKYKPMYPNFPEQVLKADEAELYLNAIFHYFTAWVGDITNDLDVIWLPKYRKESRDPLTEKVQLTVLRAGTETNLRVLGSALAASNTSISEADKADLRELIKYDLLDVPTITNKENLAVVAAALFVVNTNPLQCASALAQIKTGTDVLRLATAMSSGDVSLAKDSKFRSFKRAERRLLLAALESNADNLAEDMLRHEMRWVRLGERLHPGEYAKQFPKTVRAFNKIRNGLQISTFNSKVEKLILEGKAAEVIALLRERPGDFARRLDHLLRLSNESSQRHIVNAFMKVASFVSTPVLLQVLTHFKSRNLQNMRVVFPKGNTAKVQAIVGNRAVISADTCGRVVMAVEHTLNERFSALPKLGKVYVDPKLADYLVPFSQRSASKSTRTLVRGSKIAFPAEKNIVRFFIHWKNQGGPTDSWDNGRVDLDLSALMYDTEFKYKTHIAYFNLRDGQYEAVHSGDITNAPDGACEFIDINIDSILKYGGRYVIMMVNSFTHQPFNTVPECYAGFMLREKVGQRGEIYDPKTVVDKIDVTSESKQVMPLIIDCVERKVIWADAAVGARARYANNIASNYDIITLIGQAFTKVAKPDLYTLFSLHAQARGRLVTDPKKADKVFSVEVGTPFELETIASEFMKNAEKKKAAKA